MNTKGGLRCGESVVKITNMRRATPRLCPDLTRTDEEREEGRVCEDYFGVKSLMNLYCGNGGVVCPDLTFNYEVQTTSVGALLHFLIVPQPNIPAAAPPRASAHLA